MNQITIIDIPTEPGALDTIERLDIGAILVTEGALDALLQRIRTDALARVPPHSDFNQSTEG